MLYLFPDNGATWLRDNLRILLCQYRSLVFIKCIVSQIQYTIMSVVFQNSSHPFPKVAGKRLHLCSFSHKLFVVQITLIHAPHIYETQYSQQRSDKQHGFQFSVQAQSNATPINMITKLLQASDVKIATRIYLPGSSGLEQAVLPESVLQSAHFHARTYHGKNTRGATARRQRSPPVNSRLI